MKYNIKRNNSFTFISILCFMVLLLFVFLYCFSDNKKENISVTEFGAIGTDSKDDTKTIQKAIDQGEHNIIYFPKGNYIINSPLKIGSHIVLKLNKQAAIIRNFKGLGSNNATLTNKNYTGNSDITIIGGELKARNSSFKGKSLSFWNVDGLNIYGTKFIGTFGDWTTTFRNCSDVNIYKVNIDTLSDQLYSDGLHFVGGKNIVISKCKIFSGDDSLSFTIESNLDKKIQDVKVTDCYLKSRRASVVKIYTKNRTKGKIENIDFSNIKAIGGTKDSGQAVILNDESGTNRIQNIRFTNVNINSSNGAGYGTYINAIKNLKIKDYKIYNSDGTGIVIKNSKNVKIEYTKIANPRNPKANGISILKSNSILLNKVEITDYKNMGILLQNTSLATITNSKIEGIRDADVSIYSNSKYKLLKKVSNKENISISNNIVKR